MQETAKVEEIEESITERRGYCWQGVYCTREQNVNISFLYNFQLHYNTYTLPIYIHVCVCVCIYCVFEIYFS